MSKLREETEQSDANKKKKLLVEQNAGYGYGGKFGLEKDRMDKSAMGNDYVGKVEKHASQKDYATGFGGKFGVQSDRVDKSAVGWDHLEKVEKHASQKDYATGFGGKFGVQEDRRDKSALGWDHIEKVEQHESQVDHKTGFGGKFGVQSDRMDKSAVGFQEEPTKIGTAYAKTKPDICGAKPSSLRARFENFSQVSESDVATRAAEQKRLREEKDRLDRERAARDEHMVSAGGGQEDRQQVQRKTTIQTGREGGIGGTIDRFNKQPAEQPATTTTKQPIEIPRGAPLIVENDPVPSPAVEEEEPVPTVPAVVVPDVVQQVQQRESVAEKPQASISEEPAAEEEKYAEEEPQQETDIPAATPAAAAVNVADAEGQQQTTGSGQLHSLPAHEDLSEYIEDTGIRATALYVLRSGECGNWD